MSIISLEKIESMMGVNIEDVGFPSETIACLKRERVLSVGDLLRMDYDKLEYLDSVGLLSIKGIKECLNTYIEKTDSQADQAEDSGDAINMGELLETSILDLDFKIKTYYALRFAGLDTIGQIVVHEKQSLKNNYKRIKDEMLEDIDNCIKSFAGTHNCMEEMVAFPFFDENPEEDETIAEEHFNEAEESIDNTSEISKRVESILINRSLQNKPLYVVSQLLYLLIL